MVKHELEVSVNLPGTRGISREVPTELVNSDIERVLQYVIDGHLNEGDTSVARAIVNEMKGGREYSIFVAKGNEQYQAKKTDKISDLFEINPVTHKTQYQKLNLTVSRPRMGGV